MKARHEVKMKKQTLILALVLLILVSGTGIVSAQNLNGTLGSNTWISKNFGTTGSLSGIQPYTFSVVNIELTGNAKSFVHFDKIGTHASFDPNAPNYAATSFNLTLSGQEVATGTMGYQRNFNNAWPIPSEIEGYRYWLFNSWNITGLSGNLDLVLNYDASKLYNFTYDYPAGLINDPSGGFALIGASYSGAWYSILGNFTWNQENPFHNGWNATKPSGLGITGWIVKNSNGIFPYPSRAYIFDGLTNNPITSQSLVTSDDFYFNVPAESIKIGVIDSSGTLYNTSVLFAPNYTQQLPGTFNITVQVKNKGGIPIPSAHVSLASSTGPVLAGPTNSSGMITFLAVPGSAAAIVDITASGFQEYIETFSINSDMTKTITLSNPSVTVYLDVKDSTLGYYLDDLNIGIQNVSSGVWRNSTGRSGSLYFDSTGASYEYPIAINDTIVLAASKTGYRSASQTVTIPYDHYLVTLLLVNLNGTAPSSGNFTAVLGCTDMQDGKPIVGASMTLQELGLMAATNQAGVATFRNIPVGTYTIQVTASGYQSGTSSITGTDQETAMKNIRLVRNGCSLSETGILSCNGTVVNPGGGTGAAANQSANEKAAAGISAFLDNIVTIGIFVLLVLGAWFIVKIFR